MAFIPNKELYIGLSGCVTALACLWANSMRKKNRNTKTRLRQELLDLRDMIIGAEEDVEECNQTMPNPPCSRPAQQRDVCSEPRNLRGRESWGGGGARQRSSGSAGLSAQMNTSGGSGGQRRGSGAGMGNMPNFSGGDLSSLRHPGTSGADSLRRGKEMGKQQDLRKGTQAERYIVHPTATGVVVSPILPNQSPNAIKKQQERLVEKYSPRPGSPGMQRQSGSGTSRCQCPEEKHRQSCPRR